MLLQSEIQVTASLFEIPQRGVQICVRCQGVRVPGQQPALGDRVELVDPGRRAGDHCQGERIDRLAGSRALARRVGPGLGVKLEAVGESPIRGLRVGLDAGASAGRIRPGRGG